MKLSHVVGAGFFVFICAAGIIPAQADDADNQLYSFFQQYLDAHFRQQPLAATQLGDHRFDSQLDDLSKESREAWKALDQRTLKELPHKVEFAKLSRAAQVDFEVFKQDLVRSIWLDENLHPYEEDPRVYNGFISDSIYLLLTQSTLPKETNISNARARMELIPRVVEQAKKNLNNPPRNHVETAIRQNKGAIGFFEHDLFEFAGETAQLAALKASAQRVAACLKDYQGFLEKDLLRRANGQWRIGHKKFSRKFELEMEAGITADQALADAQAEFNRVERDMYVIARQLWSHFFPKAALPPDDAEGRRVTITSVLKKIGQDHSKPEELVRDIRDTVTRIKRFISEKDILRLPDPDTCNIIEMPEFQRGNSTAFMNSPPALDPKAVGFYAVSPPPKDWDAQKVESYLEEYNRQLVQILTIHEAYPGHYVQFAWANRNPSLIRKVLESGPYVEGWAVYTEQTMLDQGYGDGDLTLRMMQLKFYLRAVANTILDHRMQCEQMSDEEALKFLMERVYQSEGEARLKIIRSKQSAVQLSTYFVGRMAHYRLRQAIERELGDKFDLGRYHEAVMIQGAVPVKYLPELVRARLKQPR
jgi:uncharacterized protein (DUF885 family)